MQYLRIQPIKFGELQEKDANAIAWQLGSYARNGEDAMLYCGLINVLQDGGSEEVHSWQMAVPQSVLSQWGTDDSVIDNFVLSYSPLFVKV